VVRAEARPNRRIPDNDPAGISSVLNVNGQGTVRWLRVKVKIRHTHIGDLRVELISPTGRRALLHGQVGGGKDNLDVTYDSTPPSALTAMVGQPVQGGWILRVADVLRRSTGTLQRWSLEAKPGA
jgi:subtilisin-like proprotein convertase family protein